MKQDQPAHESKSGVVIADTSPLNYLVRLNYNNILREMYGAVLVPEAVFAELSHRGAPSEVRTWISNHPSRLRTVKIGRLDLTLSPNLGDGEREAISLAQLNSDSILLIDDRDGRIAAVERKIEISGTMAVLSTAALRGLLDFREATARLKALGFRISADHEAAILKHHEEMRRRMRS